MVIVENMRLEETVLGLVVVEVMILQKIVVG